MMSNSVKSGVGGGGGLAFGILLTLALVSSIVHGAHEFRPHTGPFYTETEKEALAEFREIMDNKLYQDYMKTDEYLINWLRSSKLNLEQAEQNLDKALDWRKANKMDTILQEDFSQLERTYPFIIDGHDREGRPIIIFEFGRYDLRRIDISGNMRQFLRYLDRYMELGVSKIRESADNYPQKNITQAVMIIDLNGFNLRQHMCIQCIPIYVHFIQTYENYYPLAAYRLYVINTPDIFKNIIEVIKPFMSEASREDLVVYGYNRDQWRKVLLDNIPEDQLPMKFGGNKERVNAEAPEE